MVNKNQEYGRFYANGLDYGKALGLKLQRKKKGAKQAILRTYESALTYSQNAGKYTRQGKFITPGLARFYKGMAEGIYLSI